MRPRTLDDEAAPGAEAPAPRGVGDHQKRGQWKRWLSHGLGLALLAAVIWFVADRAQKIDWHEVGQALRGYPVWTLLAGLALATASHAAYAGYDLLARRYLAHKIAPLKVWAVGLVSYAVNLNLGAIVGGVGFRWRLYSRLGLDAAQAARIFAFSLVANWSGYVVLAGLLLASGEYEPPPLLRLDPSIWQGLGVLLLMVAALYIAWCELGRKRKLKLPGRVTLDLPPGRVAVGQVALSMVHWLLIGGVIWMLLPRGLPYPVVLGTLLTAAVAGAVIHVPGGLGVIEAVFVASLGDRVPEGALIAALLAYRACFYLLPLAGAVALHLVLEAHARKLMNQNKPAG
jgi:uncharacterized membrane protein YbhN (UPF0104 family)